jgi:hypothetical protein
MMTAEPDLITWDGKDLSVIQMALGHLRVHGEPPYRVPDGDFARLEIWEGIPGHSGGWVRVGPGTIITIEDDGDIFTWAERAPDAG